MKPAARLTDMHRCPKSKHKGGPISGPCAEATLIAGLPAARLTDTCVCTGTPDVIVAGSYTCLIEGQPAARIDDQCVHGGVITTGCPTVLIGDDGGLGSPQAHAMSVARATAASFVAIAYVAERRPHSKRTSWIEVEVVDEAGVLLPSQLVRIEDADGIVYEAYTDEDGLVRIDGIAPGTAQVTLIALDQAVWRRA